MKEIIAQVMALKPEEKRELIRLLSKSLQVKKSVRQVSKNLEKEPEIMVLEQADFSAADWQDIESRLTDYLNEWPRFTEFDDHVRFISQLP